MLVIAVTRSLIKHTPLRVGLKNAPVEVCFMFEVVTVRVNDVQIQSVEIACLDSGCLGQ